MSSYDIVIIGGGIVGATAALLLAKNPTLSIAILDAQSNALTSRVSAFSLASETIFKKINAWQNIRAESISPYTHMHVFEEKNQAKIDFDCSDIHENALGYIIEDHAVRNALHKTFSEHENIHFIHPVKLISLEEKKDCIEIHADDNKTFSGKLVIGADGANSWVRAQTKIDLQTFDYDHTAIVATVKTEKSHEKTAWQRFLLQGPLAFLPLTHPHTSSIVWSMPPDQAKKLLALDNASFQTILSESFENKLGKVTEISERAAFPLQMRHVKNYIKPRIALIGDAAHTIHPMAGLGVNMGIQDARILSQIIFENIEKNRDFSSMHNLRRFERACRYQNAILLKSIELLHYGFTSDKTLVQTLRSFGLNFTDRVSFLKNFFASYAAGSAQTSF